MPYQNLEKRIEREYNSRVDEGKPAEAKVKSVGERIIKEILNKYQIAYTYEKQLLVEEKRPKDTEKERLWYPDFYLENLKVAIEYVGSDKPDYLKGIEAKKETYEKMGLKVIGVYGEDIFEMGSDNKPHKYQDFESNLLRAIVDKAKEPKGNGTKKGTLETNFIEGYLYKHAA